jgi:hypothetical protein
MSTLYAFPGTTRKRGDLNLARGTKHLGSQREGVS